MKEGGFLYSEKVEVNPRVRKVVGVSAGARMFGQWTRLREPSTEIKIARAQFGSDLDFKRYLSNIFHRLSDFAYHYK